jgi:hypothetical protein
LCECTNATATVHMMCDPRAALYECTNAIAAVHMMCDPGAALYECTNAIATVHMMYESVNSGSELYQGTAFRWNKSEKRSINS